MRRRMQQRLLREDAVLGQYAVEQAARGARELLFARGAADPVLKEAVEHPISGLEAGNAWADRLHGARRVRERNEREFLPRAVASLDGEQVAVVQRHRPDPDEHLAGARLRDRTLHQIEAVDAVRAPD